MATDRHPLADSFRGTLDSLRLLTARLDDPLLRGPVMPRFQAGLLTILQANPRPSRELCGEIYTIQSTLHRLFRSPRHEYAMVARINLTLEQAKLLVEKPPSAQR